VKREDVMREVLTSHALRFTLLVDSANFAVEMVSQKTPKNVSEENKKSPRLQGLQTRGDIA